MSNQKQPGYFEEKNEKFSYKDEKFAKDRKDEKENKFDKENDAKAHEFRFHEIKSDAPSMNHRTAIVWAKNKAEATDLIENKKEDKKEEREKNAQASIKVLQYREIPEKEIQVLLGKNEPNPSTLKIKYSGKELTFGQKDRVQYL